MWEVEKKNKIPKFSSWFCERNGHSVRGGARGPETRPGGTGALRVAHLCSPETCPASVRSPAQSTTTRQSAGISDCVFFYRRTNCALGLSPRENYRLFVARLCSPDSTCPASVRSPAQSITTRQRGSVTVSFFTDELTAPSVCPLVKIIDSRHK